MLIKRIIFLLCISKCFFLFSQQSTYVDDKGVFRWFETHKEIRLFGVNYTLPFAHGYRAINYIGKSHKDAIDKDVYHIARLGVDAFRIHIWDAEITDNLGNLINTEQLDLLDYSLSKMKERGIKTIVTPFKVGGNGYPEKDFPTKGFSGKLQKWQTYSGTKILEKQECYFTQFLNHVNPYTGIAYKNDPDIIAIEINNEPKHDDGKIATAYINKMVQVIRDTGFKNPIFYNVSERPEFIDNYLEANIQGCTFQWYPTGLVHNSLLLGNFLPNVDKYQIPFENKKIFQNKARAIYEFDPADTNSSVLFPAMARSFREAKFQFVAQFAYDPLDLAYANTEYQTHYLNLTYTPSKSLSLMIASQVFHDMQNGQSYGRYPENLSFSNTILDPDKDLALYNSKHKFIYTNSTDIQPKQLNTLRTIAGVGSSSIIHYTGTGAYFLDKIENGVWRLEVLPDVLWVKDPFEKASLNKTVAVVKWNEQKMGIKLLNLGDDFKVKPLNENNKFGTIAKNGTFQIRPGTYLVSRKDKDITIDNNKTLGNILFKEYVAPKENLDRIYVVHQPLKAIEKDEDLFIEARIVAPSKIESVKVILPSGYQKVDKYPMEKSGVFSYVTTIPKSKLDKQSFDYYIVVKTAKGKISFPSNISGTPEDWDFVSNEVYSTSIVKKDSIVVLFDAINSLDNIIWPRQWNAVKYKTIINSSKFQSDKSLKISIDDLNAQIPDMTFKICVTEKISDWLKTVNNTKKLVVRVNSGDLKKQKIQIALQLDNGDVFGKIIELIPKSNEYEIPFSELQRVSQVLLPRPYPEFQSYWFQSETNKEFDPSKIEAIQVSVGPGIPTNQYLEPHQVEIQKIYLK